MGIFTGFLFGITIGSTLLVICLIIGQWHKEK